MCKADTLMLQVLHVELETGVNVFSTTDARKIIEETNGRLINSQRFRMNITSFNKVKVVEKKHLVL